MAFELPNLPYPHDALEPVVDTSTMQIHHGKHHAAYVSKLNDAVAGLSVSSDANGVIRDLAGIPQDKRTAVRNNGGGHANHSLFWPCLAPKGSGGGGEPTGDLAAAISAAFGSGSHFRSTRASSSMRVTLYLRFGGASRTLLPRCPARPVRPLR